MCLVRSGVQGKVFIFKIAEGHKVSDKLLLKIDTYYKLYYINHCTECSKGQFSKGYFFNQFVFNIFFLSPENAVHDFGDLSFEHLQEDDRFMNVPFPRTVGRANELLSEAISGAVGAGHTAVMLGGDHRYRAHHHE